MLAVRHPLAASLLVLLLATPARAGHPAAGACGSPAPVAVAGQRAPPSAPRALPRQRLERGTRLPDPCPGVAAVVSRVVPWRGGALVQALLSGDGVEATADEILGIAGPDGLREVAREGEPVPGWPAAVFGRGPLASPFGDGLSLLASDVNARGHVLVAAWLTTPSGPAPALGLALDDGLRIVAVGAGPARLVELADAAAGLPDGLVLEGFRAGRLAADDVAAVEATAVSASPGSPRRRGLWWIGAEGGELVVAEGLPVPGRPGAEVTDVTFHGVAAGPSVVFTARFRDEAGAPRSAAFRAWRAGGVLTLLLERERVIVLEAGASWLRVVRSFALDSGSDASATVTFDDGTRERIVVGALLEGG